MIDRIEQSLKFQSDALRLRAQRQQVLASNIANADTPGYKAVDFDFTSALKDAANQSANGMRTGNATPSVTERQGAQASGDGNTVDMDTERAQFLDNAVRYEATLKFVNSKIRTMLTAIQGQ